MENDCGIYLPDSPTAGGAPVSYGAPAGLTTFLNAPIRLMGRDQSEVVLDVRDGNVVFRTPCGREEATIQIHDPLVKSASRT